MKVRPSGDQTWMEVAYVISRRATCDRGHVGAVLVNSSGYIISTGYNGSPKGMPHCAPDGACAENGHCACSVHAELNALLQAGLAGRETKGSTLYTTASPCKRCMCAIINSNVSRIVYSTPYRVDEPSGSWALKVSKDLGIEMVHFNNFTPPDLPATIPTKDSGEISCRPTALQRFLARYFPFVMPLLRSLNTVL